MRERTGGGGAGYRERVSNKVDQIQPMGWQHWDCGDQRSAGISFGPVLKWYKKSQKARVIYYPQEAPMPWQA